METNLLVHVRSQDDVVGCFVGEPRNGVADEGGQVVLVGPG